MKQFLNSPLDLPRLEFRPRIRAAIQIGFSATLLLALYGAYHATPRILKATPHTGMSDAPDVPGWVMLLAPIVAIIPAVYIFLFLKYNWHQ